MRKRRGIGEGETTGGGERSIGRSRSIRTGNEDNAVAGNNGRRLIYPRGPIVPSHLFPYRESDRTVRTRMQGGTQHDCRAHSHHAPWCQGTR